MGEREDGADLYNPVTPRLVLAEAYKALWLSSKDWTVADYKRAGSEGQDSALLTRFSRRATIQSCSVCLFQLDHDNDHESV